MGCGAPGFRHLVACANPCNAGPCTCTWLRGPKTVSKIAEWNLPGLSVQNGLLTIAVTTHGGQAITTQNALFPNASEAEAIACQGHMGQMGVPRCCWLSVLYWLFLPTSEEEAQKPKGLKAPRHLLLPHPSESRRVSLECQKRIWQGVACDRMLKKNGTPCPSTDAG